MRQLETPDVRDFDEMSRAELLALKEKIVMASNETDDAERAKDLLLFIRADRTTIICAAAM